MHGTTAARRARVAGENKLDPILSKIGSRPQTNPTLLFGKLINCSERHAHFRKRGQFDFVAHLPDHFDSSLTIVPGESVRIVFQIVRDRNVWIECYFVIWQRKTSRESWLEKTAADLIEIVIVLQRRRVA